MNNFYNDTRVIDRLSAGNALSGVLQVQEVDAALVLLPDIAAPLQIHCLR